LRKGSGYTREKLSISFSHDDGNFGNLANDVDVIIKDSWPPLSKAKEELKILANNRGSWGVAQIYTGYEVVPYRLLPVCAPAGARLGETYTAEEREREVIEEAEDILLEASPLGDSGSIVTSGSATVSLETATPLARTHVRIVFKTEGVPLTTVADDKVRIKALLDAVIGEWSARIYYDSNLLTSIYTGHFSCFESGWLHGDVSIGNVLYVPNGSSGSLPKW
jgi:hypothetical protein